MYYIGSYRVRGRFEGLRCRNGIRKAAAWTGVPSRYIPGVGGVILEDKVDNVRLFVSLKADLHTAIPAHRTCRVVWGEGLGQREWKVTQAVMHLQRIAQRAGQGRLATLQTGAAQARAAVSGRLHAMCALERRLQSSVLVLLGALRPASCAWQAPSGLVVAAALHPPVQQKPPSLQIARNIDKLRILRLAYLNLL